MILNFDPNKNLVWRRDVFDKTNIFVYGKSIDGSGPYLLVGKVVVRFENGRKDPSANFPLSTCPVEIPKEDLDWLKDAIKIRK